MEVKALSRLSLRIPRRQQEPSGAPDLHLRRGRRDLLRRLHEAARALACKQHQLRMRRLTLDSVRKGIDTIYSVRSVIVS